MLDKIYKQINTKSKSKKIVSNKGIQLCRALIYEQKQDQDIYEWIRWFAVFQVEMSDKIKKN